MVYLLAFFVLMGYNQNCIFVERNVMMKENFKISASLFGYIIITGIMCSVCFFSMKLIFNFVFTETIGYQVSGTIGESDKKEHLYTYIYEDGDTTGKNDTKWAEYEEKGYTLYK